MRFKKLLCLLLLGMLLSLCSFALAEQIQFSGGVHYLPDPALPDRLVLYCMNNQYEWPHATPSVSVVPPYASSDYLDAVLTDPQYAALAQKLQRVLFAGYPHNGKGFYYLVQGTTVSITEAQYNQMLKPTRAILAAFPALTQHSFTLANRNDPTIQAARAAFFQAVYNMQSGDQLAGLSKKDIQSSLFYKAAFCLQYDQPIVSFTNIYASSCYVTEAQAYEQTQYAVWKLLHDAGVPGNTLEDIPSLLPDSESLARVLLAFASSAEPILTSANPPAVQSIQVEGDPVFRLNETNGSWRSGIFTISEPAHYHGAYTLHLPQGVRVVPVNGQWVNDTVHGSASFYLVSDLPLNNQLPFSITTRFQWPDAPLQFSPPDGFTSPAGKLFQHMAGQRINTMAMRRDFMLASPAPAPVHPTNPGVPANVPKTVDSTPLLALAALAAGSFCALLLLRKKALR